jgi:hypothetical protein
MIRGAARAGRRQAFDQPRTLPGISLNLIVICGFLSDLTCFIMAIALH